MISDQKEAQTFIACCAADGVEYELNQWSSLTDDGGRLLESYVLPDYPYDEIWLTPRYPRVWRAEEPVPVTLSLR